MPTEFTRAQDAAALVLQALNNGTELSPEKVSDHSATVDALMVAIVKFEDRLSKGILGPSMGPKISELRVKIDLCHHQIQPHVLAAARVAAERLAREEEEAQRAKRKREEEEEEREKAAGEEEQESAKRQKVEDMSSEDASPSSSVPSCPPITQAKQVADASDVILKALVQSDCDPLSAMEQQGALKFVRSNSATRRVALAWVSRICDEVGFEKKDDESSALCPVKTQALLEAIMKARNAAFTDDHSSSLGWNKWAKTEAEAAFRLMDADHNGTITFGEFVDFFCLHPLIFGPVLHIERLFTMYDIDHNGVIDEEELYSLLLEVEIEASASEPSLVQIADHARDLFYRFTHASSPREDTALQTKAPVGLTFLDFIGLVYKTPKLLGTAVLLRSYFRQYDTDGNDVLDKDELTSMFAHFLGDSGHPLYRNQVNFSRFIDELFKSCDKNEDGVVDFPELCEYVFRDPTCGGADFFRLVLCFPEASEVYKESLLQRVVTSSSSSTLSSSSSTSTTSTSSSSSSTLSSSSTSSSSSFASKLSLLTSSSILDSCSTCNAPLLPRDGIARMGHNYCGQNCLANHTDDLEDRISHMRKYSHSGFGRSVTSEDYAKAGFKGGRYRRW